VFGRSPSCPTSSSGAAEDFLSPFFPLISLPSPFRCLFFLIGPVWAPTFYATSALLPLCYLSLSASEVFFPNLRRQSQLSPCLFRFYPFPSPLLLVGFPVVQGVGRSPLTPPPRSNAATVIRSRTEVFFQARPPLLPEFDLYVLSRACPFGMGFYASWKKYRHSPSTLVSSFFETFLPSAPPSSWKFASLF